MEDTSQSCSSHVSSARRASPIIDSETLTRELRSPASRTLARSILGTTDPRSTATRLDSLCRKWLGSSMREVFFVRFGVGAVFGVRLAKGERVAVKAHPPQRPVEYLRAVRIVREHLHQRGFPCPEALLDGPVGFGTGLATVERWMDVGERPIAGREPRLRGAMARSLADLIRSTDELPSVPGLDRGWNWPAPQRLWPPPHNELFDFASTAAGAEKIDGVAARAKNIVDGFEGRRVIGHSDWSAAQMRFENGEVAVVYDWDSLRPDKEVVIVGIAASNFPGPNPAGPIEARSFVHDYERARGEPFSGTERRVVQAAATYAVAYMARCEHALDPAGRWTAGGFRAALREYRGLLAGDLPASTTPGSPIPAPNTPKADGQTL